MNNQVVADTIETAIELMEQRGRSRDHMVDPVTGEVCVMGAIHLIAPKGGAYNDCANAIRKHLLDNGIPLKTPWSLGAAGVGKWNDDTEDDFLVFDTLRHVVKELRNGELNV